MSNARKVILSNARPGKRLTLKVGEESVEVEVRQPSIAVKAAAGRAAGGGGDNEPDLALFTAHVVVSCTYEPGTTRRIFNAGDVEAILAAGPELDELQQTALELVGGSNQLGNDSAETSNSAHS